MLFSVALYIQDGHTATVSEQRTVGSRKAARLLGASLLRPHALTTTRGTYHRDTARAPWVDVYEKGKRGCLETLYPAAHIVPSVGERGWTP